jgi:hypothetical protein
MSAACGGSAKRAESAAAYRSAATLEMEEAPGGAPGDESTPAMPPPPPGEKLAENTAAPSPQQANPGASTGHAVEPRSPILIYTAALTMAVFEVSASLHKLEELAHELGGFLSKRDDRSITFRVPAARFQEAVARAEKLGEVVHRNVQAQDVTEEYLDIEVRLRNARAMRDRLEQLLAKAANVNDSLAIERELGRVAGEIERMEGRLKFFRDRATFSTITATFQPRATDEPATPAVRLPFPWLHSLGLGRLMQF